MHLHRPCLQNAHTHILHANPLALLSLILFPNQFKTHQNVSTVPLVAHTYMHMLCATLLHCHFSCISLPPSECPAPPSPFSLAFPCPPQNVQHLHMLCATLLHRHCLLYFLAPLRMSSTSIARASDDFYPRDSASSHPHVAACAYNTVCVYIYVCVCVCVRACLFL